MAAESKSRPQDILDEDFWSFFEVCAPLSLLTPEKLFEIYTAMKYLESRKIQGDIVECGVWRGGAMMLAAKTLLKTGCTDRDIYLYDTFEGFVHRSEADKTYSGKEIGLHKIKNFQAEVESNISRIDYPKNRIHFVAGDVMKTINPDSHSSIAYLRLDTDTYQTTLHELECLFDAVVPAA
ncbi:MAG: hypothetical protein JJ938_06660 [Roseicyclus sp.]|nr:hypothetical protein [Roseicyclus sp.]MBO6624543.1 hypothetical protein [Roseicyclus sp.]MBO6921170.1 hypothetical protein [Roseicyclus sp.]